MSDIYPPNEPSTRAAVVFVAVGFVRASCASSSLSGLLLETIDAVMNAISDSLLSFDTDLDMDDGWAAADWMDCD